MAFYSEVSGTITVSLDQPELEMEVGEVHIRNYF